MGVFRSVSVVLSCAVFLAGGCDAVSGERKTRAARRRKAPYSLLYNNDTTNIANCRSPFHRRGEPFTEAKLVASIEEVAGKGVDCYLLSPGMGWVPWWQSEVEPDYYEWWQKRTGLKVTGARSGKGYERYVYRGGDMVQVLVDTCRKHQMDPFVSLRLNDVHAQEEYVKKNQRSLVSCRFYVEHPEWHLDPEHYKRKGYYGKRGMDWAVPQVREYKLKLLTELAMKYDLAGLELDFLRHSILFREDGPSPEERIRIMTGFVSKVRKALDRKGGRRKWLCVRIPCRLSDHPQLGLDVKKLYRAGVDMFNLSDWYHTTQGSDMDKVRKILPGAALYKEITHSAGRNRHFHNGGNYGTNPNPRASDRIIYTTARIAYEKGADGISLFNFVYYRMFKKGVSEYREPPFHVMPKLTDREFLNQQPPHYHLASQYYENQLYRRLRKGRAERFRMEMLPAGKDQVFRLLVHVKEVFGERKITAKLNGKPLKTSADVSAVGGNPFDPMITPHGKHRRAWTFPGDLIRRGENQVELKLESGEPVTLFWIDVGSGQPRGRPGRRVQE